LCRLSIHPTTNFHYISAPPPPRDIDVKIQQHSENTKKIRAILMWKPPQNTSDTNSLHHYIVTISRLDFKKEREMTSFGGYQQLNFNGSFSISPFSKLLRPTTSSNVHSNSTTVSGVSWIQIIYCLSWICLFCIECVVVVFLLLEGWKRIPLLFLKKVYVYNSIEFF
jgi:hypothetical protein